MTRTVRLWHARTPHDVPCVIGQPLVEVLFTKAGQHVCWVLEKNRCEGSLRSVARESVVSGLRSSTWQANCPVASVPPDDRALVARCVTRPPGRPDTPAVASRVSTHGVLPRRHGRAWDPS